MRIKKLLGLSMSMVLALLLTGCFFLSDKNIEAPRQETATSETMDIETADSKIADNIVHGRTIFVHPNGVAFWGDGSYLCSGIVGTDGIDEVVIEAQMTYDINALAIYDSRLYVASNDGLYSYALADLQSGGIVSPKCISEYSPSDRFTLYNGKLYFKYGYTIFSYDVDNAIKTEIARNVHDYEITDLGIFYTDRDGGIYTASEDGTTWSKILDTTKECTMSMTDDRIYYRTKGGNELFRFDISDNELVKVAVSKSLNQYDDIWVTDDHILYNSADYDTMLFRCKDNADAKVPHAIGFPRKGDAFLAEYKLYGYNKYSKALYIYDLENGSYTSQDIAHTLQQQIQAHAGTASTDQNPDEEGYDIADGLFRCANHEDINKEALAGIYIILEMPRTDTWDWKKTGDTSIKIYYTDAANSGYGGTVVSIMAFDIGDDSYLDFPEYQIAGRTDDKVYIALFPTDIQFDPSNATQAKEYNKLITHAKKIDEDNSVDNPFRCY